jgi:hypothetical protein
MPKKKPKLVTNTALIREIVKKTKELDTKPSDELNELIEYERQLPIGFVSVKPTEENFSKLKARLPLDLQKIISDSDKIVEIDNYYALTETIRDLRRCAAYLMEIVSRNQESRSAFEEMPLGAFELYQQQRAELNKKFPPKHGMLKDSSKQWLKESPYAKQRRNPKMPLFIASPTFNADFSLDFESTYITKVLKGIDSRRLRICNHCSHVFWAYRLDQNYCDDVCQKRAKRSRAYKRQKENKEKK